MRPPDYMEALTGYRSWGVQRDGLLLGCSHPSPWPPRAPMTAQCHNSSQYEFTGHSMHVDDDGRWIPAPAWHCGCGVYGFKSAEVFDDYQDVSYYPEEIRVWGAVRLWGRVVEHQWGYRAEYAYPGELMTNNAAIAAKLATLYGVKVTCIPDRVRPNDDDDDDMDEPSVLGAGVGHLPQLVGPAVASAWQQALQTLQGPSWVPLARPHTTLAPQLFPPPNTLYVHAWTPPSPLDPTVGDAVALIWEPDEDDLATIDKPLAHRLLVALWKKIVRDRCV